LALAAHLSLEMIGFAAPRLMPFATAGVIVLRVGHRARGDARIGVWYQLTAPARSVDTAQALASYCPVASRKPRSSVRPLSASRSAAPAVWAASPDLAIKRAAEAAAPQCLQLLRSAIKSMSV